MQITFLRSSSYNAWDWCQHKFVIEYGLGWRGPPNKKAEAGNMIHKAMEYIALYKLALQNGQKEIECPGLPIIDCTQPLDYDKIYDLAFNYYAKDSTIKYSDDDKLEYREWFSKCLQYKDGQYNPLNLTIFGVEKSFDVQIKKDWAKYKFDLGPNTYEGYLALKGNIDLIIDHGDYIEALDYKTGRRKDWNKDAKDKDGNEIKKEFDDFLKDPQLCIYYYALQSMFPDKEIMMSIFWVNDGGVFSLPFDRSFLPKIEQMIERRFTHIKQTSNPTLLSYNPNFWKCKHLCFAAKKVGKISLCKHFHNEVNKKGLKKAIEDNMNPDFNIDDYGYGGGSEGLKDNVHKE